MIPDFMRFFRFLHSALRRTTRESTTPMTQDQLVDLLISSGCIHSPGVQEVMRMVDRKHFINEQHVPRGAIYEDSPQWNGQGQTISAPHMHAICLEQLHQHLVPGARVLDVGSGSGYLTACMALMVGPTGFVLGVDKVQDLVARSVESIKMSKPELAQPPANDKPAAQLNGATILGCGVNWMVCVGNALSEMLYGGGLFSAIHVGAAAEEMPVELLNALQPGGRMVIPIGPHGGDQVLMVVDKGSGGQVHCKQLMEVRYVPLTRPHQG